MTTRLRSRALWILPAVIGSVAIVWAHRWMVSVNDYGVEAAPAFAALLHGHLSSFLALAPAYGGSLELRAPFALVSSLSGASQLAIYRASAVPCGLAVVGLGLWLAERMARRGRGVVARACLLGLCVVNPITYEALEFGHPEELLGGVLCVAAVLCAIADRPVWAGLLLGLAIGNKDWALVAVGPVLVGLPSGHLKAMLVAGAAASLLLVPLVLGAPGGLAGSTGRLATQTGDTFHPFQIWWFLGQRIHWVPAMAATIPKGARLTPGWLDGRAHLIVVGVSAPLTLLYHRSRAKGATVLLLLALLLLLRCVLDPWDVVYYPLPFILALASWEAVSGARLAPIRAVAATLLTWIVFVVLPKHLGVDEQSVACLVVMLPTLVVLTRAISGTPVKPGRRGTIPRRAVRRRLKGPASQTDERRMGALLSTNPRRGDVNLRSPAQMLEYVAIAERIARDKPGRVLDWGCGWGQVTDLLIKAGLDVQSFDYRGPGSPNRLVPLKRYPGREAYISAESVALPYRDGEFDVVLSCGVLEHVSDPDGSLEEIKRVLQPGGTIYCHKLPNRRSYLEWIARRAGLYFHGQDPDDRLYTKRSAQRLFARHGYEVQRERYANMLPLCLSGKWARGAARPIWLASRALARLPLVNALATNVELTALTPV